MVCNYNIKRSKCRPINNRSTIDCLWIESMMVFLCVCQLSGCRAQLAIQIQLKSSKLQSEHIPSTYNITIDQIGIRTCCWSILPFRTDCAITSTVSLHLPHRGFVSVSFALRSSKPGHFWLSLHFIENYSDTNIIGAIKWAVNTTTSTFPLLLRSSAWTWSWVIDGQ